ncbi:MAG: hypothetical protein ACRC9Z_10490 [Weissella confusa]
MVAENKKMQYADFFDPADVHLFVKNVELNAFQEGTMVQITFPNNRQTLNVDAKGTGYFTGNHDTRTTLTVNLSEMSVDNAMMADLVNARATFPIKLVHNKESWSGMGMIQKVPDAQFGNAASGRAWSLLIAKTTYVNQNK